MNPVAYPDGAALFPSVKELLEWKPNVGHDRYGDFHIITGYEGTGVCFWCGGELTGKATRYCKKAHHWRLYAEHFCWTFARWWCLKRYERCPNCGSYAREAHHIIPLDGEERIWTPYNMPWNLVGLCHTCHQAVHAAMRPVKPTPLSLFDQAKANGQLVLLEVGE